MPGTVDAPARPVNRNSAASSGGSAGDLHPVGDDPCVGGAWVGGTGDAEAERVLAGGQCGAGPYQRVALSGGVVEVDRCLRSTVDGDHSDSVPGVAHAVQADLRAGEGEGDVVVGRVVPVVGAGEQVRSGVGEGLPPAGEVELVE